jgi:hypothetical protein
MGPHVLGHRPETTRGPRVVGHRTETTRDPRDLGKRSKYTMGCRYLGPSSPVSTGSYNLGPSSHVLGRRGKQHKATNTAIRSNQSPPKASKTQPGIKQEANKTQPEHNQLAGWLAVRQAGWLARCLQPEATKNNQEQPKSYQKATSWLAGCLAGWLAGCLLGWLSD